MPRFTQLFRSNRHAPSRHASDPEPGRHHHHRGALPLIALNLAIVLVLAGGTAAYGALSTNVTLTVDGHSQEIRTFGGTVGDLLEAEGVTVRPGDKVSADESDDLSDGDTIAVSYAKPVTLAVDGLVSKHTVFDATVAETFETLDVEPKPGAFVSSRTSAKVPRQGMSLVVSSPKSLTVVVDGKRSKLRTTAPTVDAVLDEASVTLDSDDEVKPGIDAFVSPHDKLRVVRIKKVTKTETVRIKHDTEVREDPDTELGKTTVVKAGKDGAKRERVRLVYADGELRKRVVLSSDQVSSPVKEIVSKGTEIAPAEPSDSVWDKIAQCESGGNWSINTGNGYYGGLQFSAATWHSVGGPGLPHESSREVQIKYAKILQARSGWGQWGCAGARFN